MIWRKEIVFYRTHLRPRQLLMARILFTIHSNTSFYDGSVATVGHSCVKLDCSLAIICLGTYTGKLP